jgi:hypothetical protein
MTYAATPAQIGFIRKLIDGKFASVVEAAAEFGVPNPGSINKNEASALIDWLKSLDRTPEQNAMREQFAARSVTFSEMLAKLIAKEITQDEFSAWQAAN